MPKKSVIVLMYHCYTLLDLIKILLVEQLLASQEFCFMELIIHFLYMSSIIL
jgi:hypothetical protein